MEREILRMNTLKRKIKRAIKKKKSQKIVRKTAKVIKVKSLLEKRRESSQIRIIFSKKTQGKEKELIEKIYEEVLNTKKKISVVFQELKNLNTISQEIQIEI